ncbi:hypothetical protein [Glaciimonas immobilis]|uniref:Uncharacterized protein n=1 Tax=Glaciimonas immobilis TaxID=728004 RepID=A0A840RQF1_9BURK|nr:hypothetical protein [Glaciimonas immobilis]KAF3999353.1 hypothetical protein HAV38_05345 [Glaciimonas immobilis]MBB5198841.1 hypothetical protein [Glaciimonas immobilis]
MTVTSASPRLKVTPGNFLQFNKCQNYNNNAKVAPATIALSTALTRAGPVVYSIIKNFENQQTNNASTLGKNVRVARGLTRENMEYVGGGSLGKNGSRHVQTILPILENPFRKAVFLTGPPVPIKLGNLCRLFLTENDALNTKPLIAVTPNNRGTIRTIENNARNNKSNLPPTQDRIDLIQTSYPPSPSSMVATSRGMAGNPMQDRSIPPESLWLGPKPSPTTSRVKQFIPLFTQSDSAIKRSEGEANKPALPSNKLICKVAPRLDMFISYANRGLDYPETVQALYDTIPPPRHLPAAPVYATVLRGRRNRSPDKVTQAPLAPASTLDDRQRPHIDKYNYDPSWERYPPSNLSTFGNHQEQPNMAEMSAEPKPVAGLNGSIERNSTYSHQQLFDENPYDEFSDFISDVSDNNKTWLAQMSEHASKLSSVTAVKQNTRLNDTGLRPKKASDARENTRRWWAIGTTPLHFISTQMGRVWEGIKSLFRSPA